MTDDLPLRSPELMNPADSCVLLIDVQPKLLGVIPGAKRIKWNCGRLLAGAAELEIPLLATEQYPEKLGKTEPNLADYLGDIEPKLSFSCLGCESIPAKLQATGAKNVLICGIETHVCVLQTVLDLISQTYRVHVAVDATAARNAVDHDTALRRMETSGAVLTTTETALFEWCRIAGSDKFKTISKIVQQSAPDDAS